jgi:hypothetical protein
VSWRWLVSGCLAVWCLARAGTPWIVINGKYLSDTDSMLETVCAAIPAPKPAGCK